VADGAILDEYEYQEMSQFTRILVEEHARSRQRAPKSEAGSAPAPGWRRRKIPKVLVSREARGCDDPRLGLVTYPRVPQASKKDPATLGAQCHGASGDGKGPRPWARFRPRRRSAGPA
jgi:hypothetical protein